MPPNFEIAYILGRGSSGSTILNLLLGNSENICSVGELYPGLHYYKARCSCGKTNSECEFWSKIRDYVDARHSEFDRKKFKAQQKYFNKYTRIHRIIFDKFPKSADKSGYYAVTRSIYNKISEQSGCRVIAESSKEFGRAVLLLKIFKRQIKFIHLIRDGRGVMWSRLKKHRKNPEFSKIKNEFLWMTRNVLFWNFSALMAFIFSLILPRKVLHIKYEDLCTETEEVLNRLGEFIKIDLSGVSGMLKRDEAFEIGHLIYGNSLRHSKSNTFKVRLNTEWKAKLPRRYNLLYILLGWPAILIYGYKFSART